MTQSAKRKNTKKNAHHSSKTSASTTGSHLMRVFMMYFVVFGTILAFIGLMGDDSLPGSGLFIWLLLALNFVIATIATISHSMSGQHSKIDEIAEKW